MQQFDSGLDQQRHQGLGMARHIDRFCAARAPSEMAIERGTQRQAMTDRSHIQVFRMHGEGQSVPTDVAGVQRGFKVSPGLAAQALQRGMHQPRTDRPYKAVTARIAHGVR